MEFFVDGELIAEFVIKKANVSAEKLAEELVVAIDKIMEDVPENKQCEFTFLAD